MFLQKKNTAWPYAKMIMFVFSTGIKILHHGTRTHALSLRSLVQAQLKFIKRYIANFATPRKYLRTVL
jgi:hypothetical protein